MAKIRYAILENDKALTATATTGTETIDLPETGILEELHVNAFYTKVYSASRPLPEYNAITKLEVLVDGSTVVKSVSGVQARALMWYNKGPFHQAFQYWRAGGGKDTYCMLPLYFNKQAGDHSCGLNLSAYSNPQLKITYDTSQTTIDGETFEAATSPTLTYNVMAKIIDGTPAGYTNRYVQTKELKSFTATASAEQNIEIPRGYDLKSLMIRSAYKGVSWTEGLTKVKLDFDNGKWVPIDMDYENIKSAFLSWYPDPVTAGFYDGGASQDDINLQVMQVAGMGFAAGNTSTARVWFDMHECGLYDLVKYTDATAHITSAVADHIQVSGWGPMQTINIPMGQLTDGAVDSVRTTDYGRIDCKITAGASTNASQKTSVVAEYFKPNGG